MLWRLPYIAYPTFLKFRPTPFSRCFQPSPPLLFLMSCSFELMGDCDTFDVLFQLMILWIYKCRAFKSLPKAGTLVPKWPCYVFHTHTYIAHSGTNRLTYPYKYILTPSAMWSQQIPVLHWIIHWYQKFTFHNVFSFQKLLTWRSCISVH